MTAIHDLVPPEVYKALQDGKTDYLYFDVREVMIRNAADPSARPLAFSVRHLNVSDGGRLKLSGHVLRPDLIGDDRNILVLTIERRPGEATLPAGPVGAGKA